MLGRTSDTSAVDRERMVKIFFISSSPAGKYPSADERPLFSIVA
jgi:hypothetical protein